MSMQLRSSAFQNDKMIPKQYTIDGKNVSPPLEWIDAPDRTRSFAVICDDPDAPRRVWVHWVLFNVPADFRRLPEAIPPEKSVLGGVNQGRNDFGRIGYGGPAPPAGRPHRYCFSLYALDTHIDAPAGISKEQLLEAMRGHVLDEAQLAGTYVRDSDTRRGRDGVPIAGKREESDRS
jgi:Raf kinase inhibitor-like YbhB/YbcL family protein